MKICGGAHGLPQPAVAKGDDYVADEVAAGEGEKGADDEFFHEFVPLNSSQRAFGLTLAARRRQEVASRSWWAQSRH